MGAVSLGAFRLGTAGQDADDRLIYVQGRRDLYYDPDGIGATPAILFAQLDTGTLLHSGNFTLL